MKQPLTTNPWKSYTTDTVLEKSSIAFIESIILKYGLLCCDTAVRLEDDRMPKVMLGELSDSKRSVDKLRKRYKDFVKLSLKNDGFGTENEV